MIDYAILKSLIAASWFGVDTGAPDTLTTVGGVSDKIIEALNFFTGFAAFVAVVLIVYGGFTYITAGGDDDKVKQGSGTVTNAVIGLVIVLLASLIIRFTIFVISTTPASS